MKEDILAIYKKFDMNKLGIFFDELIEYVNKYESVFSKYISQDYLKSIRKLDSKNLMLGHSDDNFEVAISFYTDKIVGGLNEEEISTQISLLIWDLSAYMTEEVCPSCHDSNLRLTSMIKEKKVIVKFCDECLYTGINDEHVEIEEDLVPASKELIESYLNRRVI